MRENNVEKMLSQLIRMVGSIQANQQEMKLLQLKIHDKLDEIEIKVEKRHKEILDLIKAIEKDLDFI